MSRSAKPFDTELKLGAFRGITAQLKERRLITQDEAKRILDRVMEEEAELIKAQIEEGERAAHRRKLSQVET